MTNNHFDLLAGTVRLLHALRRVETRSGLFSSLLLPLLGFCATIAPSALPAESTSSCPAPPTLGAAIGRDGRVGCPGRILLLVCLVSPHNKGQTMSLIGGRDESSSARCILALYRGVRHILNTPKSFFVLVDCVSIQDLNALFDNTRCNWYIFAPTKGGGLLFHSSSARSDAVLKSTPHVCCRKYEQQNLDVLIVYCLLLCQYRRGHHCHPPSCNHLCCCCFRILMVEQRQLFRLLASA